MVSKIINLLQVNATVWLVGLAILIFVYLFTSRLRYIALGISILVYYVSISLISSELTLNSSTIVFNTYRYIILYP